MQGNAGRRAQQNAKILSKCHDTEHKSTATPMGKGIPPLQQLNGPRPTLVRSTVAITAAADILPVHIAVAVRLQARAAAGHAVDGLRRADGVLADAPVADPGGRGLPDHGDGLARLELAPLDVEVRGVDEVDVEAVIWKYPC